LLTKKSFAKVNLTLEILNKRDDGFHDIASVIQSIDLHDEIYFQNAANVSLTSNLKSMESKNNLIVKSAELLKELTGYEGGIDIYLKKCIPLSSGMGGGSSNAACTLFTLNTLWNLQLSFTRILEIGLLIGSDIPFFLNSGTVLVKGKGDLFEQVSDIKEMHFVIVTPRLDINNKTATLYGHITPEHFSDGSISDDIRDRINQGFILDGTTTYNAFETVYDTLFPEIATYRRALLTAGAAWVRMTGSGPSIYTFVQDMQKALSISENLSGMGYVSIVSSSIQSNQS
jgi:4-diphosphocytidyl-2-C-methyl-D-erythritol kinase